MKKNIALLMALILTTTAVNAAEITRLDKNIADAAVTVTGNGFHAGEKVNVRILYPGVTSVADGKQTGTVAWMGDVICDENGGVCFTAGMPASTNRQIVEFNLDVITSYGSKVSKVIKWVDNDGLAETVTNIKRAASPSAAMSEITTKADALDIQFIEPWNNFTDPQKSKIATSVYSVKNSFDIFDDAIKEVNYLVLQEALNAASAKNEFFDILNTYKTMLDASVFDETVSDMNDVINAEFETRMFDMRGRLDGSKDAFKYTFKEAVLAAEISKLDRNAPLINVIKDYADVLINKDADMADIIADFKTASEDKQLAVCDALLENRAATPSKISSIIKNTLYANSNGNGGGAGGSGGSGKKTGGYSVASSPVAVAPSPNKPADAPNAALKFDDISESHYAYKGVQYLASKGIVNGYSENSKNVFKPDADMTRAEFIKTVLLAFGFKPQQDEYGFADVASDSWYAPYVNTAAKLGIVNGVDENNFGVDTKITREQMCTVIYRTAIQKNITLKNGNDSENFADSNSISDYASEAVNVLKAAGIISGDETGNFNPGGSATRANVAKILYGILATE